MLAKVVGTFTFSSLTYLYVTNIIYEYCWLLPLQQYNLSTEGTSLFLSFSFPGLLDNVCLFVFIHRT